MKFPFLLGFFASSAGLTQRAPRSKSFSLNLTLPLGEPSRSPAFHQRGDGSRVRHGEAPREILRCA